MAVSIIIYTLPDLRLVGWDWLRCQRWRSHCWSRLRWFHQFHGQNLEGTVESEGRQGATTVVEHGASTQVRLVKDALTYPPQMSAARSLRIAIDHAIQITVPCWLHEGYPDFCVHVRHFACHVLVFMMVYPDLCDPNPSLVRCLSIQFIS